MLRVCANTAIHCRFNPPTNRLVSSLPTSRLAPKPRLVQTPVSSTSRIGHSLKRHALPIGLTTATVMGCAWKLFYPTPTTKCDPVFVTPTTDLQEKIVVKLPPATDFLSQLARGLRLLRRVFMLMLALSPVIAFYPLLYVYTMLESDQQPPLDESGDAHEVALASLEQPNEIPKGPVGWYYRMCLGCVEWSGAAAIKIMQWAGSRPDMFGQAFCSVFSQLQDDTTPHAWKHTRAALKEAYGDDWEQHIRLDKIIGSGCIAQVYKGVVWDADGKEIPVAVKVMHPNVEDDIDADLDIMRLSAYALERFPVDAMRNLKWMNLPGFVEEMSIMLKIQLDLRTEADHLVRFNENFKHHDTVVFPKLVDGFEPSKNVLIETFCEGTPIMEFVRNNTTDRSLLTNLCKGAINAVCQMIFLDNFIHGDLHPGNVLISEDLKFVLLDVGMVVENTDADHRLISNVLASFIRHQGRKAGRFMIDDSNNRLLAVGDHSLDEELFLDKIEDIAMKASGKEYLMENLGTYITQICNAAAVHHVMLNQAFISAALAVKVQEGMALALDPSVKIYKVATPIIMEGERRHGLVAERTRELLGVNDFWDWLQGKKPEEEMKGVRQKSVV
eukprot:Nitzschia sp. Nitz4//scaffold166_size90379//63090//65121//NITZ4_005065-RA/size90379-augustus-gene-0.4-mRNA-1//1//CDS//3329538220//9039//frame0